MPLSSGIAVSPAPSRSSVNRRCPLTVGIPVPTMTLRPVTVSLTYDDPTSIPAVAWLFPSTMTLHAQTTMRQEFG